MMHLEWLFIFIALSGTCGATTVDVAQHQEFGSSATAEEQEHEPPASWLTELNDTSSNAEDDGGDFADIMPLAFDYLGCFKEAKQFHAVPYLPIKSPFMTVQMCAIHCRAKGMQIFGLTEYNKCRCACADEDTHGKYGQVAESACNTVCEGGDGVCGGLGAVSVYKHEERPDATDKDITDVKAKMSVKTNTTQDDQGQIHENDPRAAAADGGVIAQGDMAVPLEQVAKLLQLPHANVTSMLQMPSHHADFLQVQEVAHSILSGKVYLWEGGVVNYYFDGLSSKFTGYAKRAIQALESKTCLKFKESRTNAIQFKGNEGGCWSYVGAVAKYLGGKQPLNLGASGCDDYGVVAHEIGHALGMHHEHSRPDRDKYIKTFPSRFSDPKQFEIMSSADTSIPYDIGSLMHYNPKIFTRGGDTMEPKVSMPPGQKCCGTYAGFTEADIAQLNSMYKCKGVPRPSPRPSPRPRPSSRSSSARRRSPSPRPSSSARRRRSSSRPSPRPTGSSNGKCLISNPGWKVPSGSRFTMVTSSNHKRYGAAGGAWCLTNASPYCQKQDAGWCGGKCNCPGSCPHACGRCPAKGSAGGFASGATSSSGGRGCGQKCGSSGDCGSNLFCCPFHSLCMDKSTKSTAGPNCGGSSQSSARRRSSRRRSSSRRRRRTRSSLISDNSTSVAVQSMGQLARELSNRAAKLAELMESASDNETDPSAQECADLENPILKALCLRKGKDKKANLDSSVKIADCDDVEKKKIISVKLVTGDAVDYTGHSYLQYITDPLRSPGDHVLLVPAGTQLPEMDKAALRKVLIPPINILARRADTVGFIAVVMNPDVPPDAKRRAEIPEVKVGKYELAYVRELVKRPQHKFIKSGSFEVVPSAPTQPGMVKGVASKGKLDLTWSEPLFSGGANYSYDLELCEVDGGSCSKGEWRTAVVGATENKASVTPSEFVPEGCFDAAKRCMWRAKAASSEGQSKAGWVSAELPAASAMSAISLNGDDAALGTADGTVEVALKGQ